MEAIFELDRMLTDSKIPHVLRQQEGFRGAAWQIVYPNISEWEKGYGGDVVWNECSYGNKEGLLEAMGFDITEEKDGDTVVGWLTAEDAYKYFERQFEKDSKNEDIRRSD